MPDHAQQRTGLVSLARKEWWSSVAPMPATLVTGAPLLGAERPFPDRCIRPGHPFYLLKRLHNRNMSRSYKIALILKSKSSLPVYKDLAKLSDRELDEHVSAMIRRMRTNESAVIARMVLRQPTFSLN